MNDDNVIVIDVLKTMPVDDMKNIIGLVDTPIGRRKYPKELVESVKNQRKFIIENKL